MSSEFASPVENHRLRVFEEITEAFELPPSRLICISYGPHDPFFAGIDALLLNFGPMQEFVEKRETGEAWARYFDLRHTKEAANFLGRVARVDYLPDEASDCVAISSRDYARCEAVALALTQAGSIISIKHTGQFLVSRFFDLRAAFAAAEELSKCGIYALLTASGLENSFSDSSEDSSCQSKQLTDSGHQASSSTNQTEPSPYMHGNSSSFYGGSSSSYAESLNKEQTRRKPRKKHTDEEDKALYSLDPQKILDGLDARTTIMIKNIPNKYTQQMLLMTIDAHFANTYDFFYLPIDFKNKCNVGYAFVNFLECATIPAFYKEMNGRKWDIFKSEKIGAITYARIQGRAALIQHFQSSSVMSQDDAKIKPLIFPLPYHDIFIALAITYASSELFVTWSNLETCSKPIQVWLLVSCLVLLLFRLAHIVGDTEAADEMYEPWCFNLFTTQFKLHTVVVAGLLYPFFVFWVLLGTVWYAIVQTEKECFRDPQQSWYIMLWLVIFYIWIIAYTTAITTSAMVLIRQRQLERQYNHLLEQYEGEEVPFLLRDNLWQAEGLSPGSIGTYEPHIVTNEELDQYSCSICLDEVTPGEKIRIIDCGHGFHMACIDPWLLGHGECPNCKRNLRRQNRDIEEPLLPQ